MSDGLHPLLAGRRSPRRFDEGQVLSRADLRPLLEAARWAPSRGNGQPVRWVVALRGEPVHDRLVDALSRGNRSWAPRAAALLVVVLPDVADDPDGQHAHDDHDGGQAVAHLTVQAGAQGLAVHQMAGFDPAEVHRAVPLGADRRAAVLVAVGAVGGSPLEEGLAAKEARPRTRLPLEELVLEPG